ncbi:MAG: hypothetical protein WC485_10725 [Opitutaceae bacterium]
MSDSNEQITETGTPARPGRPTPRTERETVYRLVAPWLIRKLPSRRNVTATGQDLQRLGYRVALLLHKGAIALVESEAVEPEAVEPEAVEPELTPEDLERMTAVDADILDAGDGEPAPALEDDAPAMEGDAIDPAAGTPAEDLPLEPEAPIKSAEPAIESVEPAPVEPESNKPNFTETLARQARRRK